VLPPLSFDVDETKKEVNLLGLVKLGQQNLYFNETSIPIISDVPSEIRKQNPPKSKRKLAEKATEPRRKGSLSFFLLAPRVVFPQIFQEILVTKLLLISLYSSLFRNKLSFVLSSAFLTQQNQHTTQRTQRKRSNPRSFLSKNLCHIDG